jgi:hypothetical protein
MAHKWQDRTVFSMRVGAPAIILDDEEARTLAWAEIAGLIEIDADGSWKPTAFGWQQMRKLQRDEDSAGGSH